MSQQLIKADVNLHTHTSLFTGVKMNHCVAQVGVGALLPPAGSVIALHPVRGGVHRVVLLNHLMLLVHAPVLAAFKHVRITISPRHSSINAAGDPLEQLLDGPGVRTEVCRTNFIPRPVP